VEKETDQVSLPKNDVREAVSWWGVVVTSSKKIGELGERTREGQR